MSEGYRSSTRGGRIGCGVGGAAFVIVGLPTFAMGAMLASMRCEGMPRPCSGSLPGWTWPALAGAALFGWLLSRVLRCMIDRNGVD